MHNICTDRTGRLCTAGHLKAAEGTSALTPPDTLRCCQGMQSICRDRDAIKRTGMSSRDGSELLALPWHSLPVGEHDHYCEQQGCVLKIMTA